MDNIIDSISTGSQKMFDSSAVYSPIANHTKDFVNNSTFDSISNGTQEVVYSVNNRSKDVVNNIVKEDTFDSLFNGTQEVFYSVYNRSKEFVNNIVKENTFDTISNGIIETRDNIYDSVNVTLVSFIASEKFVKIRWENVILDKTVFDCDR